LEDEKIKKDNAATIEYPHGDDRLDNDTIEASKDS
jgi:hypothetical protein